MHLETHIFVHQEQWVNPDYLKLRTCRWDHLVFHIKNVLCFSTTVAHTHSHSSDSHSKIVWSKAAVLIKLLQTSFLLVYSAVIFCCIKIIMHHQCAWPHLSTPRGAQVATCTLAIYMGWKENGLSVISKKGFTLKYGQMSLSTVFSDKDNLSDFIPLCDLEPGASQFHIWVSYPERDVRGKMATVWTYSKSIAHVCLCMSYDQLIMSWCVLHFVSKEACSVKLKRCRNAYVTIIPEH